MLNITKTTKNRRWKRFLLKRRSEKVQSFIKSYPRKAFTFVKEKQGHLFAQRIETGAYKVEFRSKITGRSAFAYGASFEAAYHNMIRMYNLKHDA
ncbi:hypothetical protein [Riemerella columbipharyngis]|uniref:Uncharacterized protein n=1 Tax=Riemerella columbipharyngis TaxID=1071918 RepID=A0A1G7F050_9FLAO|nr:hypothetical protein [Riemerella columbipharyngis]SDE69340.1 hypothetical protein SAMN05421544_11844 [Riemerella columbipharyngis]